MKKNKDPTQPIYKIWKRKLVFDSDKNKAKETKLLKKMEQFRISNKTGFTRDFKIKK